ncbi:MAG: FAD-binding oxidoreductase [Pirellulales bacterium]|nr:FAD-binding oxidoreductase [Pirellulales bacterium]
MHDTAGHIPLTSTLHPADTAEVTAIVERAYHDDTAIYPIGGGTSLEFGAKAGRPGLGLRLDRLQRIVDYPARDMTITVEAGISCATLATTLAAQGQRLPIDVPRSEQATLGGAIATNTAGPRRFGYGTLRDYVIGISAVDGRGVAFKGGGRVVKNVAGYDFCKLLTGSLGTLGIITQVTFKVRPQVEASALAACCVADWQQAERVLGGLTTSQTTPVAVELLAGPDWLDDPALAGLDATLPARVVLGFEGTHVEVAWQLEQIDREWRSAGVGAATVVAEQQVPGCWQRLTDFPEAASALDRGAAAVVKLSVLPSRLVELVAAIRGRMPDASIQAHAGNGICVVRLPQTALAPGPALWREFLWPQVQRASGHAVVLASADDHLRTPELVWGPPDAARHLMTAVKQQFDPRGLLNPGRFVY